MLGIFKFGIALQMMGNVERQFRGVSSEVLFLEKAIAKIQKRQAQGKRGGSVFVPFAGSEGRDLNIGAIRAMLWRQEEILLGRMATAIAIGVGGVALKFLSSAVDESAKFQKNMARIDVLTGNAGVNLQRVRTDLHAIASITGKLPEEIGKITEFIGQAGLAPVLGDRGMRDFATTVAMLSEASGENLQSLIRQFTRINDQLKLVQKHGPDALRSVGSAIQLVGRHSTSGAAEVMRFTTGMLTLRHQAGLTLSEIIGLAGTTRSWGRVTEELLSSQLPLLYQKISKHPEVFARALGMTTKELEKFYDQAPFDLMMDILQLFANLPSRLARTRLAEELQLTNVRLIPLLSGAAEHIDKARSLAAMAAKELRENGESLREDFERMMNNVADQSKVLRNNFAIIQRVVGMPFLASALFLIRSMNAALRVTISLLDTFPGQMVIFTGLAAAVATMWGAMKGFSALVPKAAWDTMKRLWQAFSGFGNERVLLFLGAFKKGLIAVALLSAKVLLPIIVVLKILWAPLSRIVERVSALSEAWYDVWETGSIANKMLDRLSELGVWDIFEFGMKNILAMKAAWVIFKEEAAKIGIFDQLSRVVEGVFKIFIAGIDAIQRIRSALFVISTEDHFENFRVGAQMALSPLVALTRILEMIADGLDWMASKIDTVGVKLQSLIRAGQAMASPGQYLADRFRNWWSGAPATVVPPVSDAPVMDAQKPRGEMVHPVTKKPLPVFDRQGYGEGMETALKRARDAAYKEMDQGSRPGEDKTIAVIDASQRLQMNLDGRQIGLAQQQRELTLQKDRGETHLGAGTDY